MNDFKLVTTESFEEINAIYKAFDPYSDFSPVSLFCWNANNTNAFMIHNGNLVIRFKDYLSESYIYSLLGRNQIRKTIDKLFKLGIPSLSMVPEIVANEVAYTPTYVVEEDRVSHDYIIDLNLFGKIDTIESKNQRKHIRTFEKIHPEAQCLEIDLKDSTLVSTLLELNTLWAISKNFDATQIDEDIAAINKFIDISEYINSVSIGLFLDSKIVAFTFNELLDNSYVMGHFGKSSRDVKYASLYCEYASAKILKSKGYDKLNIQQDTGIIGLRDAKVSYHPSTLLKKYSIKKAA